MLSAREERGVGGVFLFLQTKQGNNIQVCSWYPGDKESSRTALTTDLVLLPVGPRCRVVVSVHRLPVISSSFCESFQCD